MARSTSIATRRPGKLAAAQESAKRARTALTSLRRERVQRTVPDALKASGAMLTGAAACGAARALLGDDLMGAPTDVIVGAALIGAGVATRQTYLIHSGAGSLAGYVRDYTEEGVASFRTTTPATVPNEDS